MNEIEEIAVSHGPCFGQCPVDTVSMLPSGRVLLAGQQDVPRVGHYRSGMGREEWAHLCRVVEESGFWDAEDRCHVDDWPITSFRVSARARQKTVHVQSLDWPYELWLLNAAANEVAYRVCGWKAEESGLRGQLQNPPPTSEWQAPHVVVERVKSPDASLAVDGRLMFRAPLDEAGAFSIPLRAGHYKVHSAYGAPSEDLRIKPGDWREVLLSNP